MSTPSSNTRSKGIVNRNEGKSHSQHTPQRTPTMTYADGVKVFDEEGGKGKPPGAEKYKHDWQAYCMLAVVLLITMYSYPAKYVNDDGTMALGHVWYCGWLTAVSTGLGVIPFLWMQEPENYYLGISNAVAGGMMIAASLSLCIEGFAFNEVGGVFGFHSGFRVVFGLGMGVLFVIVIKRVLDRYEDLKVGSIQGASAQKILLIMLVMTLHSLTEGVGIGVSFGGKSGQRLGQMISLSLAVHNIPEGVAVCAVLTSRKVDKLRAALWAVFTSLPQPLCAVPAYLFVEKMLYSLPFGLGFAGGAMGYVAVFELLTEAVEYTSIVTTTGVALVAAIFMVFVQECLKGGFLP